MGAFFGQDRIVETLLRLNLIRLDIEISDGGLDGEKSPLVVAWAWACVDRLGRGHGSAARQCAHGDTGALEGLLYGLGRGLGLGHGLGLGLGLGGRKIRSALDCVPQARRGPVCVRYD